jgi:hypothetical protein
LAENHLRLIQHLDQEAIEAQYLVDDREARIGRMTGIFRFA